MNVNRDPLDALIRESRREDVREWLGTWTNNLLIGAVIVGVLAAKWYYWPGIIFIPGWSAGQ